jgi:hypothetical protein
MSKIEVDTTRLPLLLHELRLPAIARLWLGFTERADQEGWGRNRPTLPAADRTQSRRGPPAARQDAGQFRLRGRADAQQGAKAASRRLTLIDPP